MISESVDIPVRQDLSEAYLKRVEKQYDEIVDKGKITWFHNAELAQMVVRVPKETEAWWRAWVT